MYKDYYFSETLTWEYDYSLKWQTENSVFNASRPAINCGSPICRGWATSTKVGEENVCRMWSCRSWIDEGFPFWHFIFWLKHFLFLHKSGNQHLYTRVIKNMYSPCHVQLHNIRVRYRKTSAKWAKNLIKAVIKTKNRT